jgi:hypothetical protein
MANTTNFGWETPDDTDLVKDGAAAMRTLGNAIDASFIDLKGGTTGQVLSKASNTDLDFTWVAQDDSNAIQNAIVDAKGDLITATGADTPARLAVGTNNQVLMADSTTATGLKWGNLAAGGMTLLGEIDTNGATSAVFSSINQSYKHLLLTWEDIIRASANGNMYFNINDATADHLWANIQVAGSTVGGATSNTGQGPSWPLPNNSTPGNHGAIWFYEYSDTTFRKPFDAMAYAYSTASSNLQGFKTVGFYDSDTAITKISLIFGGATFSGRGTVKLWGVS